MTRRIITYLISLIFTLGVSAQQTSPVKKGIIGVLQNVVRFSSLYPQEKVYLHFDNTGYFMGETIWYKAYLTSFGINTKSELRNPRGSNGSNNSNDNNTNNSYFVTRNSDLSKVLYVELVSPGGDVLETQKLHIDDEGGAWGQFKLDSLLGTGFYEVRAYTRYMLNWGAGAMFSRAFPIFEKPARYGDYSHPTISTTLYKDRNPNTRDADSLYLTAAKDGIYTNDKASTINAHFYPEGGDLVGGLKSRVAFVVIDDNGAAYCGKGQITDASGNVVCPTETDSAGRGVFEITPMGEKLFLSMTNPKGKAQKFELPAAKSEGCSLHLDVINDEITATIASSLGNYRGDIGYAVTHNGSIVACDTMAVNPLIELSLLREAMPEGVNQITIFDDEGRILAERLFFICPKENKADSILFTTQAKGLGPCSVVEIEAHARPNSTFSFSALDYGSMTGGREGNAKTWMLLSSDVKGYIADIDYYFEADDEEHRRAADLLMMVQGWRRYDWELMSGRKWFENPQPIEDQLYLYGQLREYKKKNPVGNVEVETYIYNTQGQNLRGTTLTDSLGKYILNLPDISGDWSLQIFTKLNDKRKTYYVGIDRQFAHTPRFITPDETRLIPKGEATLFGNKDITKQKEIERTLEYAEKVRVIPQVTVKARKKFFTNDNISWYSQRTGRHWASIYYNAVNELDKILDQGEAEPTIFEFLAKKNPLFGNPDPSTLPHITGLDFVRVEANRLEQCEEWDGGMAYGGRKIRWIIDNGLGEATSDQSHFHYMDSTTVMRQYKEGNGSFQGIISFPLYMSDIKAIYIVPWSPKEEESAVRIYIYRQQVFTTESQKGLRRTRFQGYNVAETFSQEDLNVLPPLENLRRTLFWDPNVKTDASGKAKIEFYNNMSCQQILISAEGITPDGQVMVGE